MLYYTEDLRSPLADAYLEPAVHIHTLIRELCWFERDLTMRSSDARLGIVPS